MRRSALVLVFLVVFGSAIVWGQESRRIRRLPVPPTPVAADAVKIEDGRLPPAPSRPEIENAVQQVAKAYGHADLEVLLASDFPNRGELLDSLRRIQDRATDIRLYVESLERVEIGAWQGAATERQGDGSIMTLYSTCLVDVRTRLSFDDPDTGDRIVRDVGRGEWQIRFSAQVFKVAAEEDDH